MSAFTTIEISSEILHSARMTPLELKRELALALFQQDKLSFGKARELAEMTVWDFQQLLGVRNIPIQYGEKELEEDLKTIEALNSK